MNIRIYTASDTSWTLSISITLLTPHDIIAISKALHKFEIIIAIKVRIQKMFLSPESAS